MVFIDEKYTLYCVIDDDYNFLNDEIFLFETSKMVEI